VDDTGWRAASPRAQSVRSQLLFLIAMQCVKHPGPDMGSGSASDLGSLPTCPSPSLIKSSRVRPPPLTSRPQAKQRSPKQPKAHSTGRYITRVSAESYRVCAGKHRLPPSHWPQSSCWRIPMTNAATQHPRTGTIETYKNSNLQDCILISNSNRPARQPTPLPPPSIDVAAREAAALPPDAA
jgi:hypothetical protein